MRIGLLLFASIFLTDVLIAQCDGHRYRDFVFADFDVETGILYGSNTNYLSETQELFLDVYSPSGDDELLRPLVIVAHGGSFVAGSRDAEDVVPLCQDLAKMGYVVASIDYRLGVPFSFDITTLMFNAAARGFQDSKAAVRFFRKDVAENGNTYGIDQDKIFFAGSSAGGFNAIHVAYLNSEDELPPQPDYDAPGLAGGVEGESGNAGYSSAIAGAVNIAGAIWSPDIMEGDDTPVCSFHGTEDLIVPFATDMLVVGGVFNVDTVHGSATIHSKADELGLTNCFHVQAQEGHVPHVSNGLHYDTLLSITSNFLSHLVCDDIELDCSYRSIETIVTATEELAGAEALSLWPNPAQDKINLRGLLEPTPYNIVDVTGQVIERGTLRQERPSLDISELRQGLYLFQLLYEDQVRTIRFHKRD